MLYAWWVRRISLNTNERALRALLGPALWALLLTATGAGCASTRGAAPAGSTTPASPTVAHETAPAAVEKPPAQPAVVEAPAAARPVAAAPVVERAPLTPKEIAARAIPAIALIRFPGALGSGFVVGADGRIATNLHVLGGGEHATVVLADGREFTEIEVLGIDPAHDLALLRVPARDLPVLPLGDSDAVKPGERVVAIGHPLGLGNTVSDGLVSAVREVDASLRVLQVSAPISPGSSGGPLLNDRGEVIGVSTLIFTQGQNLNFGVPVAYLRPMLANERPVSLADLEKLAAVSRAQGRRRAVPTHELSLLEGCTMVQLHTVARTIEQAISVGAPLYNDGNHEACYRVYEGAALELDRKLGRCGGPRKALLAGVKRAAKLDGWDDKAWAMRDAFDGLLEVLERKFNAAK
jgi:S1-C subfamily serine protease